MPNSYPRTDLRRRFFEALEEFNDFLDSDISEENVFLEFFTPSNGLEVYEKFCEQHFPKMLEEDYKADGYFETFGAQAFLNETGYGVLIREDIDFAPAELHRMFLHEISHLYCSRNETEGGNFFDKYCMGSGVEDGMMNAGYAIWRETVADILADSIISEYATITLASVKGTVRKYYEEISQGNPDSKRAMSLIIVYIMLSKEVASTTEWSVAENAIRKTTKIEDSLLVVMLSQVFDQLHREPFWRITPEFVMGLGETYLSILAHKSFRGFYALG